MSFDGTSNEVDVEEVLRKNKELEKQLETITKERDSLLEERKQQVSQKTSTNI